MQRAFYTNIAAFQSILDLNLLLRFFRPYLCNQCSFQEQQLAILSEKTEDFILSAQHHMAQRRNKQSE